ncbi:hypothetical protein ACJJTC_011229 [Scirpophaga incertulas]
MYCHKYKLLLFVVVIICGVSTKTLPSYIQVCRRDPVTINECALRSIEELKSKLSSGLPELNVPGIEPFYIPEYLTSGSQIPLGAVGKDIKVTGASDFSIKNLMVDLDNLTIRARVRFPRLHLEGQYSVNMQVLVVPIKGKGTMKSDAVKCDAELVLKARLEEIDGVQYMKFTSLHTDISIKDYHIRLDGLFNGDKVLGDATNAAINQNRGEFLKAVKPYLENNVSKVFLEIANKVVDGIPYDVLLPKS